MLSLRLHRALIEAALAEAGLPGAALSPLAGAGSGQPLTARSGPDSGGLRAAQGYGGPARDRPQGRAGSRGTPAGMRGSRRAAVYVEGRSACKQGQRSSAPGARGNGAAVRQMEVVGVRVEMPTNQPIVLLKETQGERYLPIWIGPMEATAIAFAQQGMVPARPLTHDLIRDILEAFDVQLRTVNITALRDGIFFADLIFSNGKEVSARPSDSIALALRTGATIFASEEILDEAGIAIPDEQEDEVEKFREFLDTITPEDSGGRPDVRHPGNRPARTLSRLVTLTATRRGRSLTTCRGRPTVRDVYPGSPAPGPEVGVAVSKGEGQSLGHPQRDRPAGGASRGCSSTRMALHRTPAGR